MGFDAEISKSNTLLVNKSKSWNVTVDLLLKEWI